MIEKEWTSGELRLQEESAKDASLGCDYSILSLTRGIATCHQHLLFHHDEALMTGDDIAALTDKPRNAHIVPA